jgi:hypothetical protein
VIEVDWAALGFTEAEARAIASRKRHDDEFTFGRELAIWAQWVKELSEGRDLQWVELESAWAARDSLDLSLRSVPLSARQRVFAYVDELDRTFREVTVPGAPSEEAGASPSWWRGRIPIRSGQRLYLFELLEEPWRDGRTEEPGRGGR